MSESDKPASKKPSEGAQQLAAAEQAAQARFEKAMAELREGAHKFSASMRSETEIDLEEIIDPDGDVVANVADVEGDAGAIALAVPIELLTFDTWLFGQIGDKEELDLKDESHWETWFTFGSWIGETLRRRHGGNWILFGDDPHTWRIGFSKVFLEIAPFVFAEQLLRMGTGAIRKMITEIEKIREQHDQAAEDKQGDLDRFGPAHYLRLHTVPLGQWMAMDFGTVARLWNEAPIKDLTAALREAAPRLGPQNAQVVDRIVDALSRGNQERPVNDQTNDRGLFEAVAQILGLRRATAPIPMDILERVVVPAMHVGLPEQFPPLDEDDLGNLRKGIELFVFFCEVVPHQHQADDEGFLGSIPHEHLSTPYADRSTLEIGKGDWVVVDPAYMAPMLKDFDPTKLLDKYDDFVKYVGAQPDAPRRRDDGRLLAETAARALADLKLCVGTALEANEALLFRLLPPPG